MPLCRHTKALLVSLLVPLLALAAVAGAAPGEQRVEGPALGTRYAVRVAGPGGWTGPELREAVERVLERVDADLSTWRSDSDLMRFNRARHTDWVEVSPQTARVADAARRIAARSGGAFDPSVGPLVRLWGFGAEPAAAIPPAPGRLAAARQAVGFALFHVRVAPPALRKDRPALELDLSGIAKGHAVDAIARRLQEAGARHFLVDVGGEIRARGRSPRGGPWTVAIEDPLAAEGEAPARVALRDAAIATSGSYRNFRVSEGARLPHVLDPHTGAPVPTDLVSVSVIAPTAMAADGWATALLASGPERGWALAQEQRLAALFVSARPARDGGPRRRATQDFHAHWVAADAARARSAPEETP